MKLDSCLVGTVENTQRSLILKVVLYALYDSHALELHSLMI